MSDCGSEVLFVFRLDNRETQIYYQNIGLKMQSYNS